MFQGFQQRLQKNLNLDFLDNKIAEEQAKQQPARGSSPAKRTASNAGTRRGAGRADVQGARSGGRLRPEDARNGNLGPASKGPDPEEFMLGEDGSDISRATTPRPVDEAGEPLLREGAKDETSEAKEGVVTKGKERLDSDSLPQDVLQKLAKLETVTTRYQDLLRNYRTAHAHVTQILPFEATLREHTPLTSISDPSALVEFLNQRNLQSEMVLQELKRITSEHQQTIQERDRLKKELQEAERMAKEEFDKASGLQKKHDEPKSAASPPDKKNDDAFFSYEEEVSRTEVEDEQHTAQIEQLRREVKLQKDQVYELSTANSRVQEELQAANLKLTTLQENVQNKEEQLSKAQSELSEAQSQRDEASKARDESTFKLEEKAKENEKLRKELSDVETRTKRQDAQAGGPSVDASSRRSDKRVETMQTLIDSLKARIHSVEEATKVSESKARDLRVENDRLNAERSSSGEAVPQLSSTEETVENLEKKVALLQKERDAAQTLAETEEGHKAEITKLRDQLKRAEEDRNTVIKLVLACRSVPSSSQNEDKSAGAESELVPRSRSNSDISRASALTVESDATSATSGVPSIEGDGLLAPVEAPKKGKKKKSKAKKNAPASKPLDKEEKPTSWIGDVNIDDLVRDPSGIQTVLQNVVTDGRSEVLGAIVQRLQEANESRDVQFAISRRELELSIEEKQRIIQTYLKSIRAKDEEIETLLSKLKQADAKAVEIVATESERLREATQNFEETLSTRTSEYNRQIASIEKRLEVELDLRTMIEDLTEEKEAMEESVIDLGQQATDFAHDLKQVREAKKQLQEAFDKLQADCDEYQSRLKTAESQIGELQAEQRGASDEELQGIREQLEASQREKDALQLAKEACDKQIEALKAQQSTSTAESDAKYQTLSADLEKMRTKSNEQEKELAAANQLAQTRFRDLTDLREHVNKLQPELRRLKEEAAELKTAKTELDKVGASVKRLEAKERDLRSEIAEYRSQSSAKDSELFSLKERAKKSDEQRVAMEEACDKARRDLERSESTRNEVVDARDKAQRDLKRFDSELKTSRSRLEDLEKQVKKFSDEASGLRDEVQMKTAQQQSAQSAMDSMQDQTRELATQMKEARERNESLLEELQDAQRLLSERSGEGETMRRLLNEVEGRAEQRVKEMRQEMELANEERDRAEDEVSQIGRRKARELEELKGQVRNAEHEARRAADARAETERREREFQSRQAELESRATQARGELTEVRTALTQLREALDEGERQSRELGKERVELRRMLDERDGQLERLKKSSRTMAEELQKLQAANKGRSAGGGGAGSVQSSRSSMESARIKSPVSTGDGKDGVDYVYLKNVLLQFLEQREKKNQMQLVPVLGMLLHFDRQEEQKWMAAISAK